MSELPKDFEGLNRMHPLHAIRTREQYAAAHDLAKVLMLMQARSDDQLEYLDTLTVLMEAYEREHHAIPAASPLEVLRMLVSEHDMAASDLGRVLGNRQLGAAVLRGDRQLSKGIISKLAAHFHVSPAVFLDSPTPARTKRRDPRRQIWSAGRSRKPGARSKVYGSQASRKARRQRSPS